MKKILLVSLFSMSFAIADERTNDFLGKNMAFKFGDPSITLDNDEISKNEFMAYTATVYGTPVDELPSKEEAKELASGYVLQKKYAQKAIDEKLDQDDIYREQLEMYKTYLLANLYLESKQTSMEVDESTLKEMYNDMISEMDISTEYLLSQVLVEDKKEADQILMLMNSGELTFIDAVQKFSIDESSIERDGMLDGWFNEKYLPSEVSQAILNLKENEYTQTPIKTEFGYHIFWVNGKRSSTIVSFEDSKFQLKMQAVHKKITEKIEEDRKNLHFIINSEDDIKGSLKTNN